MRKGSYDGVMCRIWATEIAPNGHSHRCHSESVKLKGDAYPRGLIKDVLKRTRTIGGFVDGIHKEGTWQLIACENIHDGLACRGCPNSGYRGKKTLYGED